jgi:hypothetical protein
VDCAAASRHHKRRTRRASRTGLKISNRTEMRDKIFTSKKDLALSLNRNPRFVRDMIVGGFRFPAKLCDAVKFLRQNPHPTKFRSRYRRRIT